MTLLPATSPMVRRPRWLMAVVVAMVATVVACGDSTGPTTPIGAYVLSSVNSKSLPFRLFADTGFTVDITASSLVVNGDGSFLASFRSEERVENNLSVYVDTTTGKWVQAGNAITFTNSDSVKQVATWTGANIAIPDSSSVVPLLYLYTRK